jgi:rubrerythrin
MSFTKFLDLIDTEGFDKKAEEKFLSRKDALGQLGKVAISALPLGAVAAFASPTVQAQSNDGVVEVLNYALTLEHLEYRFYQTGVDASGLIGSGDLPVFDQIRKHEEAHVALLQGVISDLGGTPVEEPDFDFTAGGAFDPFNNYGQFMALSQAFEDTGVRAYKGQAGAAQANSTILTAALRIHSVEARHASQVRRMRGSKGWITQDNGIEGVAAADDVYADEDTTQQVVEVDATLNGDGEVSADNITEAWDEPLGMDTVNSIASLFIDG